MPVTIFPKDDSDKIAVSFTGNSFRILLDLAKKYKLSFKERWRGLENVWIGHRSKVKRFLEEVNENVESVNIDAVSKYLESKPETRFERNALNHSLLLSDPLGHFQIEGIQNGISQNRLLYRWDMGTGKTFTSVSVINHLFHEGKIDRLLIVAPSESVLNFERELIRFSPFFTEDDIYIADRKNRQPFESGSKVIIMTYRTFVMLCDDAWKAKNPNVKKKPKSFQKELLPIDSWGSSRAIILDESHLIKNPTSKTANCLHLHKHYFDYRYELSGTPAPKGWEDYYSQIKFLDESVIDYEYYDWLNEIAVLGNKFSNYAIREYKQDRVNDFLSEMTPWVHTIRSEDVLDLPELSINEIWVTPSSKHMNLYQRFVDATIQKLREDNDGQLKPHTVREKLPYLSLAIDDPTLIDTENLSGSVVKLVNNWKFTDHSNLEPCTSVLESYIEYQGQKTILWSGHPRTLDRLAQYYAKYDPIVIHGGVSNDERDGLLTEFRTRKDRPLLLASYKVLHRAVNIVEATRNIYWDRSWDYENWSQSIKRTHRHGQKNRVIISPLILSDTLSVAIKYNLEGKKLIDRLDFNEDSLSKNHYQKLFAGKVD